jgi:hypothetical protein
MHTNTPEAALRARKLEFGFVPSSSVSSFREIAGDRSSFRQIPRAEFVSSSLRNWVRFVNFLPSGCPACLETGKISLDIHLV